MMDGQQHLSCNSERTQFYSALQITGPCRVRPVDFLPSFFLLFVSLYLYFFLFSFLSYFLYLFKHCLSCLEMFMEFTWSFPTKCVLYCKVWYTDTLPTQKVFIILYKVRKSANSCAHSAVANKQFS
jgi:hypothetical protein